MILEDIERQLDSKFVETEKICHHLFKNSLIKYFVYNRIYDSGEIKSLTTNIDIAAKTLINNWMPTRDELKVCNIQFTMHWLWLIELKTTFECVVLGLKEIKTQ